MKGRTRVGAWGTQATAQRLADIHAALVASMTCLGGWIAGSPSLWSKITWGYHVYEYASLADQVAARIFDLTGQTLEMPTPANKALPRFLDRLAALETPEAQTAGLYRVLLPALLAASQEHMEQTHPVADEPSLRILQQVVDTLESHLIWSARQPTDGVALQQMQQVLSEVGGLHGSEKQAEPHQNGKPRSLQPHMVDVPRRDERFRPLEPGKRFPRARSLQMPEGRVRLLHIALINLEIPAIEVCGRMIAAFPQAPWAMKLDLAKQIWDEARHAEMCADRLQELGGTLGQYPYHLRVWEHATGGETLAEWLITTQRIHEGNGLDQTLLARDALEEVGDLATAQIMDFILADEVNHVRSGTRWLQHLVSDPAERQALVEKVEQRLGPTALLGPSLNREDRVRAGFTGAELERLQQARTGKGGKHHG